jgi:hypothetical protein
MELSEWNFCAVYVWQEYIGNSPKDGVYFCYEVTDFIDKSLDFGGSSYLDMISEQIERKKFVGKNIIGKNTKVFYFNGFTDPEIQRDILGEKQVNELEKLVGTKFIATEN